MELEQLTRMYDFTGRTVAITGGAGVLGGDIAQALAGCGANVAILDLNLGPVEGILEKLGPSASQVMTVKTNVLDMESLRQASEAVVEKFGTVDCLVNAAGGNKPQATTSADLSFFNLPADALRWVFDLNIIGTVLPSQVFGKIMAEKPGREGRSR